MADATYARLKTAFLLSSNGTLSTQNLAQIEPPKLGPGDTLMADMIIPLSETVDEHGNMLTAHPAPLDLEIPIGRNNYKDYPSYAVNQTYAFLRELSFHN